MDGIPPDGTNLRTQYGLTDADIGFNSEMEATHRQNYLVPRVPTAPSRSSNCFRDPGFRYRPAVADPGAVSVGAINDAAVLPLCAHRAPWRPQNRWAPRRSSVQGSTGQRSRSQAICQNASS
jgi:hypothetical protein